MTIPTALTRRDCTPMQRVVLAALAASRDSQGCVEAHQTEIAHILGIGESVCRRALADLEKRGLISVVRRGTKGLRQITRVRVD